MMTRTNVALSVLKSSTYQTETSVLVLVATKYAALQVMVNRLESLS